MACNAPLVGWKATEKTARGTRVVVFDLSQGCVDLPVNIPCGKCFGCQLAKSREWATRCSHEAQMHEDNSFITLTYDAENVPPSRELRPKDFQDFMKRLRKKSPEKIKFFHCGEYGELDGRPHHHALLFGRRFPDHYYWRKSGDHNLYRSPELETLWTFGHSEIGEVSFESAGYVARYQMKSDTSNKKQKPYLTMSRNPGIGKGWISMFTSDVYPSDEIATKGGQLLRPPRYYDKQLEKINPGMFKKVQETRVSKLTEEIRSGVRQTAREKILRAKAALRRGTL